MIQTKYSNSHRKRVWQTVLKQKLNLDRIKLLGSPFLSYILQLLNKDCRDSLWNHYTLESAAKYQYLFFTPQNSVSQCILGFPGTHSVDQAGLELTELRLWLATKCWD